MNQTSTAKQTSAATVLPLLAYRGWLLAMQAQIETARHGIDSQIEVHEGEIKRLRSQRTRSTDVLRSMEQAQMIIDEVLARVENKAGDRAASALETEEAAASARTSPRSSGRSGSSRAKAKRPPSQAREEEREEEKEEEESLSEAPEA